MDFSRQMNLLIGKAKAHAKASSAYTLDMIDRRIVQLSAQPESQQRNEELQYLLGLRERDFPAAV